ncbi:MAG: acyl-CoA dehydrogenase [Bacteroidota bacterium]
MIDSEIISNSPKLYALVPLLHVAWSDAVLTPSEIGHLQDLIDENDRFTSEEKEWVKGRLDPKNPPSAQELKEWSTKLKEVEHQLSDHDKHDLVAMGIQLAEFNGYAADVETQVKLTQSLREIEGALGVISHEANRFLLDNDDKTLTHALGTNTTFDQQEMADLLDGEHKPLIKKVKAILEAPEFKYFEDEDHTKYREQVLTWCKLLAEHGFGAQAYPKEVGGSNDMAGYFAIMETLSYHDLSMVIKYGVQFGLFGMSIMFLGTEKHHKKYLPLIGTLELPGSFAMTESGHGSNVRDIETTATYNKAEDCFIIHTPNNLARKDYIGNAACHAQMATVFAKLVIDEIDFGVNAFLVPLRDKEGNTLPGRKIEDCGLKMGLNGVDNGRIWFDQVSIPKDNMLDRFAWVNGSGEFESSIASDSRRFFTMLGTLVGGRIGIPRSALSAAKSGLTIAIKYGDQRRQFGPKNGPEVPILNYRSHQRRLIPLLSNAYALHFALGYLTDRFLHRKEEDMQEIEALAAGLKAYSTWNTTATLQICREACGGKGFLAENRIGTLKNDTEIYTTFEGDNTVLMQLVAKSRLTEFKQEFHEANFFGILNYITNQAKTAIVEMNPITVRRTDEEHLLDSEFHLSAFTYREKNILTSAARRFKHKLDSGKDSFDAFNECQFHMLNVGMAYTERIVLEQFIRQVNRTKNPELKTILKKLCDLFALHQIEKNKGWYLEQGYMDGSKTKAIRRMVNTLCWEIRQEAVPLVHAFDIPESCLAAPIVFE